MAQAKISTPVGFSFETNDRVTARSHKFSAEDTSTRLFSSGSGHIGHVPAIWPANKKRQTLNQVLCTPWKDVWNQHVQTAHAGSLQPFIAGRPITVSGTVQLSPATRKGSVQNASRKRRQRRSFIRSAAGAEGSANESASLADVAAKGLGSKPLSLEEQIELERHMEAAPNGEPQSSIPLSGLVKNRVLTLAEQVELEKGEAEGLVEEAGAETEVEGSSASKEGTFYEDSSRGKEKLGTVKEQKHGASLSLSEVAKGGFGGRGLSLSEQVELERLAEEGERSGEEAGTTGRNISVPGERRASEAVETVTGSNFRRQNEIEAALGQKLQELLKEHDSSLESVPEDDKRQEAENRKADKGGSPRAGKRFPLDEVSLLRVVSPEAESALATLRAQVFYTYPDVRTMTAAQRVTARSEFRTKLRENKQEEKAVIDFLRAMKRPDHAVLALCELSRYQSLLSEIASVQKAGLSEPAAYQAPEPDPFHDVILRPATLKRTETVTDALGSFEVEREMAVVGSFAIQVGGKLAGQNLFGAKPIDVERQATERGYLYSVAVLPTIRRMGLGQYLVEEAKLLAGQLGIRHLYVHVELSNHGAERLYKETGFVSEQEESEEVANALKRPRRQILCCDL